MPEPDRSLTSTAAADPPPASLYLPPAFVETDPAALRAVMETFSFATLVTWADGQPLATPLPLLYDPVSGPQGALRGHLARANPQAALVAAGAEALAIFAGPHGYISPSWYVTRPAVPTWNYVVVHARGRLAALDESATQAALDELVRTHEARLPAPWDGALPDELATGLRAAVVGFRLDIARLEGKFKLSQNRSAADRQGVLAALTASPAAGDRWLAEWMSGDRE